VVGLARTGVAVANLLAKAGCEVTVSDSRSAAELKENTARLKQKIGLDLGQHTEKFFLNADLVVISPGVRRDMPVLMKAEEKGVEVISEVELAFRLTKTPLISVTGTNGKSTTTTLIGSILEKCDRRVAVGGNIGFPLADQIEESSDKDYIVAEISTFQLEGIKMFRPFISIILNITPDHLDRHRDMEEYIALKKRIYSNQKDTDHLVLNYDDPLLKDLKNRAVPQVCFFSTGRMDEKGVYNENGEIFWSDKEGRKRIGSLEDMGETGKRNLENVLAALSVGLLLGCDREKMFRAVREFKGLPHRIEFVREINGVRFINDSKGTNVGAVIKSLNSFSEPLVLIAGGKDKGGDYQELREHLGRVKRIVLLGESREKMKKALNGLCEIVTAENLKEAIMKGLEKAEPGDVVLFSPACASFDMFRDFEDRGDQFKEIVRGIRVKGN
jgi:UDP-N-acetylmuramoylalanine--D-glutamate ligase